MTVASENWRTRILVRDSSRANTVSREVVQILAHGGQFEDIAHLVAGKRGVKVYETNDLDAGIWWVGTAMGLIDDIPTAGELVSRIVAEAEQIISERLAGALR